MCLSTKVLVSAKTVIDESKGTFCIHDDDRGYSNNYLITGQLFTILKGYDIFKGHKKVFEVVCNIRCT